MQDACPHYVYCARRARIVVVNRGKPVVFIPLRIRYSMINTARVSVQQALSCPRTFYARNARHVIEIFDLCAELSGRIADSFAKGKQEGRKREKSRWINQDDMLDLKRKHKPYKLISTLLARIADIPENLTLARRKENQSSREERRLPIVIRLVPCLAPLRYIPFLAHQSEKGNLTRGEGEGTEHLRVPEASWVRSRLEGLSPIDHGIQPVRDPMTLTIKRPA